MKRLFVVYQGGENFFASKKEAKTFRDSENLKIGKPILKVGKGPDHFLFGVKKIGKTHSHNAHSGGHGNGFPKKVK